jgi:hypothetical protein
MLKKTAAYANVRLRKMLKTAVAPGNLHERAPQWIDSWEEPGPDAPEYTTFGPNSFGRRIVLPAKSRFQ